MKNLMLFLATIIILSSCSYKNGSENIQIETNDFSTVFSSSTFVPHSIDLSNKSEFANNPEIDKDEFFYKYVKFDFPIIETNLLNNGDYKILNNQITCDTQKVDCYLAFAPLRTTPEMDDQPIYPVLTNGYKIFLENKDIKNTDYLFAYSNINGLFATVKYHPERNNDYKSLQILDNTLKPYKIQLELYKIPNIVTPVLNLVYNDISNQYIVMYGWNSPLIAYDTGFTYSLAFSVFDRNGFYLKSIHFNDYPVLINYKNHYVSGGDIHFLSADEFVIKREWANRDFSDSENQYLYVNMLKKTIQKLPVKLNQKEFLNLKIRGMICKDIRSYSHYNVTQISKSGDITQTKIEYPKIKYCFKNNEFVLTESDDFDYAILFTSILPPQDCSSLDSIYFIAQSEQYTFFAKQQWNKPKELKILYALKNDKHFSDYTVDEEGGIRFTINE